MVDNTYQSSTKTLFIVPLEYILNIEMYYSLFYEFDKLF